MAGASGAVARSTAALWLHHVTTRSTTRCPGHPQLGKTLRNVGFHRPPLLKGHGSTPSLQFLITSSRLFSHPPASLSVALRRLGACGPGRGRARAGLWGPGSLPRRIPSAWSPMRPPHRGPGPARLPACGNLRKDIRGGSARIGGSGRTRGYGKKCEEERSCTCTCPSSRSSAPCSSLEWKASSSLTAVR